MANILAVGAHPDDIEIGIGGTVASLIARGDNVTLCDVTSGEPTPYGTPEKRREETANANSILKVENRINLGLENRWLRDTKKARVALAEVYRETRPDIILIPYYDDSHPDHVEASKIAQAARFVAKYTKTDMKGEPFYPPKIFFYFCVHRKKFIEPSIIFDISDTIEQKLKAVSAYRSQFFAGGEEMGEKKIENFKGKAAYFGSFIGASYGEPLLNLEEIGISSFDGLLP